MTEKKFTKKSASTRASKGKEAVQKGVKFEDTVAGIYRLLGAKVIQNIEICQKKVDILATFRIPGSPIGHRVIVECKDEKKAVAQNQRVMQFKGLLEIARKLGDADSAEIVTRVPWSDRAKGFARESGIALLTYAEKMAQLIDFTPYLKDMVDRFDKGDPRRPNEPPLGAYYVNLSAERITKKGTERISVIDNYINQWIERDNTKQHLAILGEYGTGKTSLCQKMAHDLAASYLKAPGSTRIPIFLNLREFTKTFKIESLITSFLDEECGVTNPRFKLFQTMNEAGIFLLIFDGFDEMAVRVDVDTLEMNLQEIEKLATLPKSKVIITSRIEFFISGEEEKKSLHPKGRLLVTRESEYKPLKITAWDNQQINSFLKKRVPLIREAKKSWAYYRDRIRDIPGLSDLSRRPVLLDMIAKTLPQLITSGKPINRPNLYETYLIGEIKRQKILKKRTLLLSEASRFSLLQYLASNFWIGKISTITFDDAMEHIEEFIKPPKSELEAYTRDFLTCSFLIREGDKYQFSHRSIMEYLIAKALTKEIKRDNPNAFGRQRLDPVVAEFLAELSPNTDILWSWIESTKSEVKEGLKYLGGNAATLLCKLDRDAMAGRNLSGTNLTGADFSLANLKGVNFTETVMKNINLIHAQFLKKDLVSAKLFDATVSLFVWGKFTKIEKGKERDLHGKFINLMNELKVSLLKRAHTIRCEWTRYGLGTFFGELTVQVPDGNFLNLLQSKVTTQSWIQTTSLYADEHEKLKEILPKYLRFKFDIFRRDRILPYFGGTISR